jgi:hypothetical protein
VAAIEGATKTATDASGEAIADAVTGAPGPSGRALSGSRNVSQAVEFPPRDGTLQFRQQLEASYRDALGRSPSTSFVDIEGTIVWTQEYLRYRVNGCGHQDAITRVAAQIQGRGIQPICVDFTGTTVNFPPRNEPFAFRQELERIYRDELRRTAVQTFVDAEGDIVWTQEYLRYRLNGCAQTEATDRVLSQVTGGPVQPTCSSPVPPTPPISSVVPTVTAPGATTTLVNSPRPNAGAGPIIAVSNNNGSLITLTASSPVDRLIVSVNTTATSDGRLSPFVVLNSYYELRFASPQTTLVLTVQGVGSFNLEFAASLGGGPLGPYQPQPFIAGLNLTGTWRGTLRNDNGAAGPIVFRLSQVGTRVTGTFGEGSTATSLDGSVTGSRFTLSGTGIDTVGCAGFQTFSGEATTTSMSGNFRTTVNCPGRFPEATGSFSATR